MTKKRLLTVIIPLGFLISLYVTAFIIAAPMPLTNVGVRRLERQTNEHQIEIEILSIGDSSISYRIVNNNPNQFVIYTNHRNLSVPRIYRRQGFIWMPVSYTPMPQTAVAYSRVIAPNSYILTGYSGWVVNDEDVEYLIILNVLTSSRPITLANVQNNQGNRIRIATRFTLPLQ